MNCKKILFTRHAFERMMQRGIAPQAVKQVVVSGEKIADYLDDKPYPSTLLLGYAEGPLHVVVARESQSGSCYVVTVYRPEPEIWDETFKKKRPQ